MIALVAALYDQHSETDNHPTFLGYHVSLNSASPATDSEFCRRNLDVCSAIEFVVANLHRFSLEAAKLTTPREHSGAPG